MIQWRRKKKLFDFHLIPKLHVSSGFNCDLDYDLSHAFKKVKNNPTLPFM